VIARHTLVEHTETTQPHRLPQVGGRRAGGRPALIRDEIRERFRELGRQGVDALLFDGMSVLPEVRTDLMGSLLAGHHVLITGPPGVGKTSLATRVPLLLADRAVVAGCPVNCLFATPSCPWCARRTARGEELRPARLAAHRRVHKVSGSAELRSVDLIGDLSPQDALQHGIHDLRAFVPGKLLRANGCVLILDFMDRVPERALNTILAGLAGERLSIGPWEETFPQDTLIVATGSERGLASLPSDLADHFDRVALGPVADPEFEAELLAGGRAAVPWTGAAVQVVRRSRTHDELERGVSTRGIIRYGELLAAYGRVLGDDAPEAVLPPASHVALPHRVKPAAHVDTDRTPAEIVRELVDEALGVSPPSEEDTALSREKLMAIVDEIARGDHFRKPLKFGLFDLLLKRIKRFPDSALSELYRKTLERMARQGAHPGRSDELTFDLLADIDEVREKQERLAAELRARLEEEALIKTLDLLEDRRILSAGGRGYRLARKGIAMLMERLAPRLWEGNRIFGTGKHRTGKKFPVGEGRVVGTRTWRFGDSYRDFSLKHTIRRAVRNRHPRVEREDIQVVRRDVRTRIDVVLCLDLSGTMEQMEKLWYAKEGAIALALAASRYGDRTGLVTFSNMASVVSDLTSNTYAFTEKVLDLDLHENAFTNLGYGLFKARSLFMRHSKRQGKQHIILVSDGDATAPQPSPARFAVLEAARAIRQGVTISCICINEENADPDLLYKIARIGRGRFTLIENTQAMKGAVVDGLTDKGGASHA